MCPGYDIKPCYGDDPSLNIWRMWRTLSLPLLPGSLWPGVVAPDKFLSIGQVEQTVCKQIADFELWLLYTKIWNHFTACKKELQPV